jgi:hypothetical protein
LPGAREAGASFATMIPAVVAGTDRRGGIATDDARGRRDLISGPLTARPLAPMRGGCQFVGSKGWLGA